METTGRTYAQEDLPSRLCGLGESSVSAVQRMHLGFRVLGLGFFGCLLFSPYRR